MFELIALLSLAYGPLAFYMWRASKRPCQLQQREKEYWEWRERIARSFEEERQRDLECIRQNNAIGINSDCAGHLE